MIFYKEIKIIPRAIVEKRCVMNEFYDEERSLSPCETIIMKAVWDKGEDISISELSEVLRTKYNKDYKRTTIVTFILNLTAKGFARQYRKGRIVMVIFLIGLLCACGNNSITSKEVSTEKTRTMKAENDENSLSTAPHDMTVKVKNNKIDEFICYSK